MRVSLGDGVKAMKKEDNERAYLFLVGLNKEFDEVRSWILGKKLLPKLREIFFEVRIEETRRKVMLRPGFEVNDDNSALVTIKNNDDSEKRKKKNLGAITAKDIGILEKRVGSSM
ncbi:hypothetical protein PVK06_048184 [Gossypium arboreum]|uniref:Retrovirus-related Pol polyprotein from transposon TNT 1-94 n=1 Tax=Gossypium arboreum TaxID=29729 RepID=A0ABR0MFC5_GOSAR|nr:hypothetical protein PVK06_048184 [Gossypium arboreum]